MFIIAVQSTRDLWQKMTDLQQDFPLLMHIDSPKDLRTLAEADLPLLCQELRQFMLHSLNQCGGHFGASMGAVELTVALHYVYNTPVDKIVWDVGHQAYIHKILTGRKDRLNTIRQSEGLAPFPSRAESIYDAFGVGHSSTSISAALGMAIAADLDHSEARAVAVIGDGGLTGGMAFEALNHGGGLDPNLLVILNDNDMSISENVGAMTQYLGRILAGKLYSTLREGSKKVLEKMPPIKRLAKKTETHLKGMVVPGTLFEELGFNYLGPIDGHDVLGLVKTLRTLHTLKGAKLLHVITTKGKGFEPAEQSQIQYHAVNPGFYDGTKTQATPGTPTYSQVFGQWLCDMAKEDSRLIGITPAMREGSDLIEFSKQFPERYHDVGIAEQHSVTFAAGLATAGKKPVVAIYSTFLQRAYDQLIHDVALQNLDVTFAIDRAGLVGADGPTHAGSFDLSFLRCIPNMVVMAPSDENECRHMLSTAFYYEGPAAVRYPRGQGTGTPIETSLTCLPIGKGVYVKHGQRIAILAFGSVLPACLTAADTINATVINMRFVKPIDEALILEAAKQHEWLVIVEENTEQGGAGSAVLEVLSKHTVLIKTRLLGLPDRYLEHGKPQNMLRDCGLDANGILKTLENLD